MKQKLDVLFFGAHPDDIELTCGGTAAALSVAGKSIGFIDLTEAELSSRGNPALRAEETQKATEVLGAKVRENLKLPDGNITNTDVSRLKVISVLRKYTPSIVFAPYPNDRHPDHIHTSELIREACFYSGLSKIETGDLPAYRPKKVYYYAQAYEIPVSFIMDISETFEKKMEAIKCYGSQFYNPAYSANKSEPGTLISSELFLNLVEARARFNGFKIGAKFGEAFFSYDSVKATAQTIFDL